MKTLFIFDEFIIPQKINLSFFDYQDKVFLFSLTSQQKVFDEVARIIKKIGCDVEIDNVADLTNLAAVSLREKFIEYIADLPYLIEYKGKNLKELFAFDNYATLWWFSFIAEKYPYNSDSFNTLTQLDSIVNIIQQKEFGRILFASQNKKLKRALSEYAQENSINFRTLLIRKKKGIKRKIQESQKFFFLKHMLLLLHGTLNIFLRTMKVKKEMARLKRPVDFKKNTLLSITYYPHFDINLAEKGIFSPKYYTALQNSLESENRKIIWITMNTQNNLINFEESLNYAQKFIKNGCILFFLEEFNSLRMQIKSLFTMFKSALFFLRIEKHIYKEHRSGNYNFYQIFKDDWYSSFVGLTGYYGILYYYLFRSLFRTFKTEKCLYLCEMHAWEKALILARDSIRSKTILLTYQHGTISKMLLNYFNHPKEIESKGNYSIPKPDKILCNGQIPYRYLRESGWAEDKVMIVEAIKYNYLKKYLNANCDKRKAVLLAFSISPQESSSILNIAYESLRGLKDIELWIRPHPFLQIEKVLELSGLSNHDLPFQIKKGALEDVLSEAKIVITGESGICIEALAFGCEVISVNVPEWINMSPFQNVNCQKVTFVNSAGELRQAVTAFFQNDRALNPEEGKTSDIINSFFYFNEKSDIPERFLKAL